MIDMMPERYNIPYICTRNLNIILECTIQWLSGDVAFLLPLRMRTSPEASTSMVEALLVLQ